MIKKKLPLQSGWFKKIYKHVGAGIALMLVLLLIIGALTSVKPTYRLYSDTMQKWTSQIKGASFLYLFSLEHRAFKEAYPSDLEPPDLSTLSFQLATSLTPNDPRSLLGREIPGLSKYHAEIIIAGEGTNYTNLPIESQAPIDVVLEDREAVDTGEEEQVDKPTESDGPTTGGKDVVFIYHSHNRESFLPNLPEGTEPNEAYHQEVNITKVGDRLGKALEAHGIGAYVDHTDITTILQNKGWEFWKSYDASRTVVTEAMASNNDLQFIFDLHRDSMGRDVTTTKIDGKTYAKTIFVVGEEHPNYQKNLKLVTELHQLLDEKYPGLSRGVIGKKGSTVNGKYNQDLSENAILIEFGGVHNSFEELYRSADAFAEVFSEYYWDAEKVSTE